MPNYVTDTHGLIWYLTNSARLGIRARAAFDSCDQGEGTIYIPTICIVEIIYLQEKGRIPLDMHQKLDRELAEKTGVLVLSDLTYAVAKQVKNTAYDKVPDMPDRIIAATALTLGLPLISRDRKIRATHLATVW